MKFLTCRRVYDTMVPGPRALTDNPGGTPNAETSAGKTPVPLLCAGRRPVYGHDDGRPVPVLDGGGPAGAARPDPAV